jgi:hypothetical protein
MELKISVEHEDVYFIDGYKPDVFCINPTLQGLLRKLEKVIASSPNILGERSNLEFSSKY